MVLPFTDARPFKGRSRVAPGLLAIIPLVPYGHQQISPDRFTGSFPLALVDIVLADLRTSGIARQVLREGDLLPGQVSPVAPYRLHLELKEGVFHRNVTLYGLSVFGTFLWLVGLPVSYGTTELEFGAKLEAPDGKSLGEARFAEKTGATEWLYYPLVPAYTSKLPDTYARVSPRLRSFLRESLTP